MKSNPRVPLCLHLQRIIEQLLRLIKFVQMKDDRTKSLLVVMLMHASLAAGQLILIPPAVSGMSMMTLDLAFAAALWVIVIAIAVANGGHLSRQPLTTQVA